MTAPWYDRCLGDRVADLADGRLDAAGTERAYVHLASCVRCRTALDVQRQARTGLASAAPAEPSADLLARLRGLAVPEPAAIPEQSSAGVRPAGGAGVRPAALASATGPGSHRGRRRRRVALASAAGAAALAVAAVMGGGSAALSGPARTSPSIAPVVDRLTDAHASTADRMPFAGPRVVYAGLPTTTPADSSSSRP